MRHSILLTAMVVLALCEATGAGQKRVPAWLPSGAAARAVCNMIAARGPAVEHILVRDGVLDANNDGVQDAVTVAMRDGTMRGEDLEFRPRGADEHAKPVDVTAEGFQPGDYLPFGARWLPYGGRIYTLYFDAESLRYPSYLGYIDASNREHLVCDFAATDKETLHPVDGRDAEALCAAVAQGQAPYAPVVEIQEADPDIPSDRWMTRVTGRISIDFANRGAPAQLALLAYESGAGRGCAFGYFDQVAHTKIMSAGETHATLMKLQGVALTQDGAQVYTAGRCDGGTPRWFVRDGSTYLDVAGGPDVRGSEPRHEIRRVRGTEVEMLCKATFAVRWTVKSMGPEFK